MNYDLAKKLMDAGFPYDWKNWFPLSKDTEVPSFFTQYPNLSDLIKACGDDFFGLLKATDLWFCAEPHHTDRPLLYTIGKTPEESVSKFWLALNKK